MCLCARAFVDRRCTESRFADLQRCGRDASCHRMRGGEVGRKEMVAAAEMDQWRSFFARAGADIWTVILEAIHVGAIDFPEDFRERRTGIAETLFARCFVMSHASNLSTSEKLEITDHTLAKRPTDDHCNSDAASLKDSVICMNNADGAHANHHPDGVVSDDDVEKDILLIRYINGIKASIISVDQPENILIEALQNLQCLQITVDALKATEIGKQVKILKKHPAKRVRALVKELMRDWKILVDEWARLAMDGTTAVVETGSGNFADARVRENQMGLPPINERPHTEQAEFTDLSKLFSFMDDELRQEKDDDQNTIFVEPSVKDSSNYLSRSLSGSMLMGSSDFATKASTNHPWEHPAPEERGSATRDLYPSSSFLIGQTNNPNQNKVYGDMDTQRGLKFSKGILSSTNPGQSGAELEERAKLMSGRKQANGQGAVLQMRAFEKAMAVPSSNANGHGAAYQTCIVDKAVALPSSDATDVHSLKWEENEVDEKLKIAKRKLHQGYQQAENAKKQRIIQVLDFQEGVKAGQHAKGKVNLHPQNKAILHAQKNPVSFQSSHRSQNRRA